MIARAQGLAAVCAKALLAAACARPPAEAANSSVVGPRALGPRESTFVEPAAPAVGEKQGKEPSRESPTSAVPPPYQSDLAGAGDDPVDLALAAGDAAQKREAWRDASAHYGRAQKLAPNDPRPLVGLARAELGTLGLDTSYGAAAGDPRLTKILTLLERAKTLDPSFAPAWVEKGRAHLMLGEAEPALELFRAALELGSRDPEAASGIGIGLLATGDVRGASEHLQRASELDPKNAERLGNWGTALMMAGDVAGAAEVYRRAAALEPRNARFKGDLGTAYLAQGRVDDAIRELSRALGIERRATFLSNLGYAYQLSGKLSEAVVTYRKALDEDPKLGSAWINLGTALAKLGRYQEAEDALRKAGKLDPEDPRVKANLDELKALRASGEKAP